MLEIEIKSFCPDLSAVEKKLISIGADFREAIIEEDVYLQHPCRDFRESGEAFRIRKMNDKYCITYKGPKLSSKAKTRFEEETAILDGEKTLSIFEKLGFVKSGFVKKLRKIYVLGNVEICLDDVEKLGTFVEIEKLGDNYSEIEKELFAIAETIGLSQFTTKSYLCMIEEGENEKIQS